MLNHIPVHSLPTKQPDMSVYTFTFQFNSEQEVLTQSWYQRQVIDGETFDTQSMFVDRNAALIFVQGMQLVFIFGGDWRRDVFWPARDALKHVMSVAASYRHITGAILEMIWLELTWLWRYLWRIWISIKPLYVLLKYLFRSGGML